MASHFQDNLGHLKDFARRSRFGNLGNVPFEEEDYTPEEIEEGRALALLAYVPFLCFIPFLKGREANRFVYEHGKQGVLLFLFEIIALLGALFWKAALFLASLIAVAGIIYVIRGRRWRIPWIGPLAELLDEPEAQDER